MRDDTRNYDAVRWRETVNLGSYFQIENKPLVVSNGPWDGYGVTTISLEVIDEQRKMNSLMAAVADAVFAPGNPTRWHNRLNRHLTMPRLDDVKLPKRKRGARHKGAK